MRRFKGAVLWRSAYLRSVRSAFATVPLYRETWALRGRTEPVLVPGRTGDNGGAIDVEEIRRKLVDCVPLVGGSSVPDPNRGLGHLLPLARPGALGGLVVLVDDDLVHVPADLPRGTRGCLVRPDALAGSEQRPVLREIADALSRNEPVLAIGSDKALDLLDAALPGTQARSPLRLPQRGPNQLDSGPYGLLYDPLLGYLGVLRECGRWHLDRRRVFARTTGGGLAVTVLGTASPRLVDVLVGGGVHAEVSSCPRHGTPVVSA